MAFCTQCGADVAPGTAFCPKCGRAQAGPAGGGPGAAPVGQTGLQENVAGLLCYAVGWITGLIFFFADKRPSVRFHAAQSIVVFGSLNVLHILLSRIFLVGLFYGGWSGFSMGMMLIWLVNAATCILWILLMIKAYQGEHFKLPVAGDFAENLAGK